MLTRGSICVATNQNGTTTGGIITTGGTSTSTTIGGIANSTTIGSTITKGTSIGTTGDTTNHHVDPSTAKLRAGT
jgi:hypothetical protein